MLQSFVRPHLAASIKCSSLNEAPSVLAGTRSFARRLSRERRCCARRLFAEGGVASSPGARCSLRAAPPVVVLVVAPPAGSLIAVDEGTNDAAPRAGRLAMRAGAPPGQAFFAPHTLQAITTALHSRLVPLCSPASTDSLMHSFSSLLCCVAIPVSTVKEKEKLYHKHTHTPLLRVS